MAPINNTYAASYIMGCYSDQWEFSDKWIKCGSTFVITRGP